MAAVAGHAVAVAVVSSVAVSGENLRAAETAPETAEESPA